MKKQLLYLDDDAFMQAFFQNYYQEKYDISLFSDAESAWKATQTGYTPDLIILDLGLPGLDGYSFMKMLQGQQHLAEIPVVVLSGEEKSETRIRLLEAGAFDYITKPFNPQELELKMVRLLNASEKKSRARKALQAVA